MMNKKDKLKHIKPALLLSVITDLEITTTISDTAGAIVDELYTMPTLRQSTFLTDTAYQFERDITIDKMTVAQLTLDTLQDSNIRGSRFDKLRKLLEELCIYEPRNHKLHSKLDTLIRKKYNYYETGTH